MGLLPDLWVPSAFVELKEEGQLNHAFPLKFFLLVRDNTAEGVRGVMEKEL